MYSLCTHTEGKFIIPKTQCTIVYKHADFDERHLLYKLVDQDQTIPQTSVQLSENEEEAAIIKQPEDITHQTMEPNQDASQTEEPGHEMNIPHEHESIEELTGIGLRLPNRKRHLPHEWWKPWELPQANMEQENATANTTWEPHGEPQSYAEAVRQPDAWNWERATRDKMNNNAENRTWSLVPRPKNCNMIGSRWVFQLKYNADRTIERHKASLVTKGYNQ